MRRALFAAAAIVIAAAAHAQTAPAAGSRYESLLSRPEGRRALTTLAAMEEAAAIDRAAIEKLMTDKRALVRVRCAEALGRIGDPAGVPLLEKLAADKDLRVAETAVYALGLVRDTSAVAPLARSLAAGDENIKLRALEALGVTGKKEAAPVIAPYLRHFKGAVRAQAALALTFAGDSASASACEALVQDPDPRVAACAAYAMGRLGYAAGGERIAELLTSRSAETRLRAVEALGRLKAKGAASMIATLTADSDRWVALKAAEALARIGGGGGADALAAMLSEDDAYIVTAALGGLAVSAAQRHAAAIEPHLSSGSAMVRRAALGAAVAAAGGDARPHLLAAIEKGTPRERTTALELLGALGAKEDLALLCGTLLREDDHHAAEGAAAGLGRWERTKDLAAPCGVKDAAGNDVTAVGALLSAANGDDWVVASVAVESLGKVGSVEIVPALAAVYGAHPSRIDGDRRLAVVEAIKALSAKLDAAAIASRGIPAFLATAYGDPDRRVSAAAASAAASLAKRVEIRLPPRSGAAGDRGTYPWTGGPSLPFGNRRIVVSTKRGEIEILLYGDDAPNAVRGILALAGRGFYDGLAFHRVVPGFVVQGGCPRGDGWGDAGYFLRNEVNLFHYRRGVVGLADSGKDTAGSQFFIMHAEHPHLDGRYTIVGRVTRGMSVVDRIEEGDVFTVRAID